MFAVTDVHPALCTVDHTEKQAAPVERMPGRNDSGPRVRPGRPAGRAL
jgi:hypothetical protein